jgi:hypothetical protein
MSPSGRVSDFLARKGIAGADVDIRQRLEEDIANGSLTMAEIADSLLEEFLGEARA